MFTRVYYARYRLIPFGFFLCLCTLLSAGDAIAGGPPQFSEFIVTHDSGDVWTAMGIVEDESPETCLVVFGDLLEGHEVTADEDGFFFLTVELEPNTSGIISAIAFDDEELVSDEVREYIE